ncbi:Radical_SAM domain containing protein [uncultured Caudovirales phage]|uniref:Radical_SAM domain containing protein n=1 Tax=uncultured Caudovirales phage TaxID=2100421 RepID=A0A6J5LGV0_9CAUD|nr:Radical_SAM domain containing protein [uncultured Caudovirales phage]
MPNQKIFCTVPWIGTHLYWDGTYGACCAEYKKLEGTEYNIKNTSLVQWHDSDTMRNFRSRIMGDSPLPECAGCYYEEEHGHESRRIKENFKVAIFTEQAFDKSYQQSPWKNHFTKETDQLPIDWHLDFGNECNLACKMCSPNASSKIAHYYSEWGIKYNKQPNWTSDEQSWNQLINNIQSTKGIHRIHIMGGEPVINKKFVQFVDWLIENNHTNISLSFVSNATVYDQELIDKLKKFSSADIEVSLESIHKNNHYIRQGSNTDLVLSNIINMVNQQTNKLKIVLRTVPQLLNINNYHELILFAFDQRLSIQSIPVTNPPYLMATVLPYDLRQQLKENYIRTKNTILDQSSSTTYTIATGRDTSRLHIQLIRECDTILNILDQPEPDNVAELRTTLISWLKRWDSQYNLDAREYYPEYKEFLENNGYYI